MSTAPEPIERRVIPRPELILENTWQKYYELGNSIADLVLDAFDVYASGDFARWDKERARNMFWRLCKLNEKEAINRRHSVCKYILVERMKEKDFFCCDLCQEVFYNYQQALTHLGSPQHTQNEETTAVRESRISSVGKLVTTFTEPPPISADTGSNEISTTDLTKMFEFFVRSRSGMLAPFMIVSDGPISSANTGTNSTPSLLEATKNAVEQAKSEVGRNAMIALHEYLGQNQPYCTLCLVNTVDRKGFYAHCIGHAHMATVALFSRKIQNEESENAMNAMRKFLGHNSEQIRFDPLTTLVNVHMKHLV